MSLFRPAAKNLLALTAHHWFKKSFKLYRIFSSVLSQDGIPYENFKLLLPPVGIYFMHKAY